MKFKPIKYILIFCLLAASLFKCSCDNDPKPDPCAGKTATSAKFKIFTNIETGSPFYAQQIEVFNDTIIFDRIDRCSINNNQDSVGFWAFQSELSLTFKATDTTAKSYLWIIGDNIVNYTTAGVTLRFNQATAPRKIEVKLIITKDADNQCFPKDNGVDTVIRTLYFRTIQVGEKHPIEGVYKGYLNNDLKDTITLTIDRTSYTEFNGTTQFNTLKYYYGGIIVDRFCNPSISNIAWIKSKSNEAKLNVPKRTDLYVMNRCFKLNTTMEGMGYINKNNELVVMGYAWTPYLKSDGKTYQNKDKNFTFTGLKQF